MMKPARACPAACPAALSTGLPGCPLPLRGQASGAGLDVRVVEAQGCPAKGPAKAARARPEDDDGQGDRQCPKHRWCRYAPGDGCNECERERGDRGELPPAAASADWQSGSAGLIRRESGRLAVSLESTTRQQSPSAPVCGGVV
jgi:hypothetical protein